MRLLRTSRRNWACFSGGIRPWDMPFTVKSSSRRVIACPLTFATTCAGGPEGTIGTFGIVVAPGRAVAGACRGAAGAGVAGAGLGVASPAGGGVAGAAEAGAAEFVSAGLAAASEPVFSPLLHADARMAAERSPRAATYVSVLVAVIWGFVPFLDPYLRSSTGCGPRGVGGQR